MQQALAAVVEELHLDRSSLTGLPFLPAYVVISAVLFQLGPRRASPPTTFIGYLFPGGDYRSSSSLLDLKILVLNAAVGSVAALAGYSTAGHFTKFLLGLQHGSQAAVLHGIEGLAPMAGVLHGRGLWLDLLFTLCMAAAHDLGRVVVHYSMHRVPALWQFHKYHHDAETLTPFTAYRLHPVEFALSSLSVGGCVGACVVGFEWVFGRGAFTLVTMAGVSVVTIVDHVVGVFEHGNKWLNLGRLGYVFASPANHLVHHSSEPEHRDKNFANHFAIFDLLLGTLYIPKDEQHFPIGVRGADGEMQRTRSLVREFYLRPFVEFAKTAAAPRPAADASAAPGAKSTNCWCGPSCPVLAAGGDRSPRRAWTRLSDLFAAAPRAEIER